ncbi:hypothetical protein [Novipirellula sp.]
MIELSRFIGAFASIAPSPFFGTGKVNVVRMTVSEFVGNDGENFAWGDG